jgi:hypothetical protein
LFRILFQIFGNVSRWNYGKGGRRFLGHHSREYFSNYPRELIQIFKGLIGGNSALFIRYCSRVTIHPKFMDESRWIFGKKEKDFLVATQ